MWGMEYTYVVPGIYLRNAWNVPMRGLEYTYAGPWNTPMLGMEYTHAGLGMHLCSAWSIPI